MMVLVHHNYWHRILPFIHYSEQIHSQNSGQIVAKTHFEPVLNTTVEGWNFRRSRSTPPSQNKKWSNNLHNGWTALTSTVLTIHIPPLPLKKILCISYIKRRVPGCSCGGYSVDTSASTFRGTGHDPLSGYGWYSVKTKIDRGLDVANYIPT